MVDEDVTRGIERSLVAAAKAGDTTAFETLVRRNVDRLYAAARLILRDADLAEDAVQHALVRTWRDLPSLRDLDRFEAWLHKLLVRACYDEARRRRRWSANVQALPVNPGSTPASDQEIADRDAIERAFRVLSPDHRAILVLHFYLDLSAVDIGARLDLPAGTARSRLHYALGALRAAIDAGDRGAGLRSGGVA